jgi:hypothetical protein
MAEIIAALDETGADHLLDNVLATIVLPPRSGSGNLGPFVANYTATATLANGSVDLIPPNIIRLVNLRLNWHLAFRFSFDLSNILPDFCLPQICVDIPFIGRVCTPRICINWPTITIPVSFGDFVLATADFRPDITLAAGVWRVEAVIVGVPNLQFGTTTALLLAAIGAAAALVLAPIPFIGPFLAGLVVTILGLIGIAGVTGLLGPILTPFISGLRIPLYQQPQRFVVLPAAGPVDPQVTIRLDQVTAAVAHNGTEDELVLGVDVSP